MAMVMVTMMMMTDDDDDDHMLDNANAWAPHLSWWVGSIEEKEAQSVLRITPRLMNLFKGPSETSMYFKLHPPCLLCCLFATTTQRNYSWRWKWGGGGRILWVTTILWGISRTDEEADALFSRPSASRSTSKFGDSEYCKYFTKKRCLFAIKLCAIFWFSSIYFKFR